MAAVSAAVRRKPVASRLHGSSRWATSAEIGKAGLLRDSGVVLCQTSDAAFDTRVDRAGRVRVQARKLGRLVRHDGPEHVLCFAPTGSGKGVGLVVPTLLTWPHSVLVYDIKKENWALPALRRSSDTASKLHLSLAVPDHSACRGGRRNDDDGPHERLVGGVPREEEFAALADGDGGKERRRSLGARESFVHIDSTDQALRLVIADGLGAGT
ncbi:MAG: type IV secretory system conjugative DNA transfer family protein [Myxococcota bacterium]|nr:type IV secretory system conjugative DNA transfer family protein [Myxococcota bacterium]